MITVEFDGVEYEAVTGGCAGCVFKSNTIGLNDCIEKHKCRNDGERIHFKRKEDKDTSTERDVWIDDACVVTFPSGGYVCCPLRMWQLKQMECQSYCAAFRIQDNFAKCQMMHGNQIIGKIIDRKE